ncbi:hypothetical protein BBF96_13665 [Anoxybacter fermentans]|uniref:histidine kinase n=1 Tax=Anoxybacter fermentans TaxID=1323375 RepID=A0A3Q9HRX0_9FIRM|nr:ATP-binding protein [Anoxybacter fermentans]AZR74343.1 hypothetical protein BBF96_13665 [Anoxybacter fermentans]
MTLPTDQIFKEWVEFVTAVSKYSSIRPITFQFWEGCREADINSCHQKFVFLSKAELEQKREENAELIKVTSPYIDYLSLSFLGKPHLVVLSDSEGWILEVCGTLEEFGGQVVGIGPGVNWSEEYLGHNGIGTALVKGEPVLIYGIEHCGLPFNSMVCLGLPIRDNNNSIIGALDICVPKEDAHPACFTLALASIVSIENALSASSKLQNKLDYVEKLLATESLLATMVHDLKNPLSTIRGISQLGYMTSGSIREQEYFKKIIKQVDILIDMLNELLGKFKSEDYIKDSPVKAIQEVLNEIEPLCRARGIELSFFAQSYGKTIIHERFFKRAMHNLLINAVQIMSEGGKLIVRVNEKKDFILIEIADTGPGIPLEIQQEVFEPFVHGRTDGTGLGLYIVHYVITKVHRGKIWFETGTNEGTTFYIKLPIVSVAENKLNFTYQRSEV